jgi:hypothetical protein
MALGTRQPRKSGSFTCARATAKTLVPSGHVKPQILGGNSNCRLFVAWGGVVEGIQERK